MSLLESGKSNFDAKNWIPQEPSPLSKARPLFATLPIPYPPTPSPSSDPIQGDHLYLPFSGILFPLGLASRSRLIARP